MTLAMWRHRLHRFIVVIGMMALMAVILEIHHPTMKEVRNEAAITLLDDTPFYLKAGR